MSQMFDTFSAHLYLLLFVLRMWMAGVSIARKRMPNWRPTICNRWKCCWAWWHALYTWTRPQVIIHPCACVTGNEGVPNHFSYFFFYWCFPRCLSLSLSPCVFRNWNTRWEQNSSISFAMLFACWAVRSPFITCCLSIGEKPMLSDMFWPYYRMCCEPEPKTSASSKTSSLKRVNLFRLVMLYSTIHCILIHYSPWWNRHEFGSTFVESQPSDSIQVLHPHRVFVAQVIQAEKGTKKRMKKVTISLFLSFGLLRGTDKLKELSRQPVVVERVEQLLDADSDPRVRQVKSIFGNSFPRHLFCFGYETAGLVNGQPFSYL